MLPICFLYSILYVYYLSCICTFFFCIFNIYIYQKKIHIYIYQIYIYTHYTVYTYAYLVSYTILCQYSPHTPDRTHPQGARGEVAIPGIQGALDPN